MSIIASFIVPHPPLIIPEIGKGEERRIQDTIDAYKSIAQEIALLKPETIIISSPHSQLYRDYFHISPGSFALGNLSQFGAIDIKAEVEYDESLISLISKESIIQGIPARIEGERTSSLDHGTMVPLYFINQFYNEYKMIRISPSGLSPLKHYEFGKLIQSVIPKDKSVVWIASGDLSHKLKKDGPYGLVKEGPIFDKEIVEALSKGNFLKLLSFDPHFVRKAAECGLGSFTMMAGVLDGHNVKSDLLSYEGPFGVGYAVAKYDVLGKDETRMFDKIYMSNKEEETKLNRLNEDSYVRLARKSLEHYIKHHKKLKTPDNLISDLVNKQAGVFVSIHKNGNLRGCIGTIIPTTKCIADEIIQNAVSSGVNDPRFSKVKKNELPHLQYKVDVLFPPESIESFSELDIKRYGVIVSSGYKSGLLLPNLEGIDTIEAQVNISKQKAGIRDGETFKMERFEVIRHSN